MAGGSFSSGTMAHCGVDQVTKSSLKQINLARRFCCWPLSSLNVQRRFSSPTYLPMPVSRYMLTTSPVSCFFGLIGPVQRIPSGETIVANRRPPLYVSIL